MTPPLSDEQRAAIDAQTERERAEQGLPAYIEDVAVLTRIATIMRLADRRQIAGQASTQQQQRRRSRR